MKTPVKYLYFLEEAIANLDKNILIVSEEYIDGLIGQIHADAGGFAFEMAMLEELLIHVKEKEEYYYNKQRESYNLAALKLAAIFLIILLILVGLLYCFYNYYHLPKKREMLALMEELKLYGITIKECSKNVYRSTEYWLEMDDTEFLTKMGVINDSLSKEHLSVEQCDRIKSMIDTMESMINQIYKIHSTLRGNALKWIVVIIGSGAFYVIHMIYTYIKDWWKPQYKERYEKFFWLQTKIEQRIACLKRA